MIDYEKESAKYKPSMVRELLIGEAPPEKGKSYFYVPCRFIPDRSLPAIIFDHYFKERPTDENTYAKFLCRLQQEKGVFLIDICDEAINVKGNREAMERIKTQEIPKLRDKIARRLETTIPDSDIIFLLPKKRNYLKVIQVAFPKSRLIGWEEFRKSPI